MIFRKQLAARHAAVALLIAAALAPDLSAQATAPVAPPPTPDQIQRGLHHAATTPGGNPTNAYDPFYDAPVPPEQLDAPGKILRRQPAPHLLNILGPEFRGYAERILYTSTTVNGTIVPVSGVVIEPANPWRGKGPTPTVVFGPGTRGSGDACAPSRGPWMKGQIDPAGRAVGTNYELLHYHAASLMGMRVVVTDYIGLGTPGPHTYVLHDEEGHAMLDAARAATKPGEPVGFWGYSQGGGASAAAAELASTYAPELNVNATFSGAPPADLVATVRAVDNSSISAVIGYAVHGWADRYEGFGVSVDKQLNDRGREFLATTQSACIADSAARWGLKDTRTMTLSGHPLSDAITAQPDIARALEAQKLGQRTPAGPVMVSTPGNDDLVPSGQVVQLARDYCTKDAQVTLLDSALPPLTPGVKIGANHVAGNYAHLTPSLKWMMDRFNDLPAGTNCGTF